MGPTFAVPFKLPPNTSPRAETGSGHVGGSSKPKGKNARLKGGENDYPIRQGVYVRKRRGLEVFYIYTYAGYPQVVRFDDLEEVIGMMHWEGGGR